LFGQLLAFYTETITYNRFSLHPIFHFLIAILISARTATSNSLFSSINLEALAAEVPKLHTIAIRFPPETQHLQRQDQLDKRAGNPAQTAWFTPYLQGMREYEPQNHQNYRSQQIRL